MNWGIVLLLSPSIPVLCFLFSMKQHTLDYAPQSGYLLCFRQGKFITRSSLSLLSNHYGHIDITSSSGKGKRRSDPCVQECVCLSFRMLSR